MNIIYKFRSFWSGFDHRYCENKVMYLTVAKAMYKERIMGKLSEFYKQHRRLFLAQKHQNTHQTEKFKDIVMLRFINYCESRRIYHTKGINKQIAIDFFNTPEMQSKSYESKRKYFLIIREFFKRFLNQELTKGGILK